MLASDPELSQALIYRSRLTDFIPSCLPCGCLVLVRPAEQCASHDHLGSGT